MGSSGGGNYAQPSTPSPPSSMISAQGSTAPFNPNIPSFLPSDPNAMATGLTPEMFAAASAPAASSGSIPGLLSAADIAAKQAGSGVNPSVAAQFLMAMGAPPKTVLGDKYDAWAAQPVTRGTLAAQMAQGKTRGREVGGHR